MSSSGPRKECTKCKQDKPLTEFHRDSAARDGHRPDCKACTKARNRRWYKGNRDHAIERVRQWQRANREQYQANQRRWREENRGAKRRADREGHLRRKYGITLADYQAMLAEQEGGCAICGAPEPEDASLHVDHDHDSGDVRGLLCFPCNNALGLVGESAGRLARMAEYLEDPGPVRARAAEMARLARERVASLAPRRSV